MSSAVPQTLEECFVSLQGMLGEERTKDFWRLAECELPKCHHALGRRIRNAWGLWSGSELKTHMEGLGLEHADDMSAVILTSFWRHLHGIPLDVEGQVSHYQRYWRKMRDES
jgi:hypothetical protein